MNSTNKDPSSPRSTGTSSSANGDRRSPDAERRQEQQQQQQLPRPFRSSASIQQASSGLSLYEALNRSVIVDIFSSQHNNHGPQLVYPHNLTTSSNTNNGIVSPHPRRSVVTQPRRSRQEVLTQLIAVIDSALDTVEGVGTTTTMNSRRKSRRCGRPNDKSGKE